jgi:hypothetical protein
MDPKIVERFWSRVDRRGPRECWPWKAYRNRKGYGLFWNGKRTLPAPQVALEITGGAARPPALQAMHSCDNTACCNPDHLSWGTGARNVRDSVERGRRAHLIGETHNRARLTEEQARAILASPGVPSATWAKRLGVCKATVSHIKTGRNWKHLRAG